MLDSALQFLHQKINKFDVIFSIAVTNPQQGLALLFDLKVSGE